MVAALIYDTPQPPKRECATCTFWKGTPQQFMADCVHPETVAPRTMFDHSCRFYVASYQANVAKHMCVYCNHYGVVTGSNGARVCNTCLSVQP